MDDLLLDHLNRLKEIDERLEKVADYIQDKTDAAVPKVLEQLRFDLRGWIERAEREYQEF